MKITKMTIMAVVASGETRGAISDLRLCRAPGSGCSTSTGTGVTGLAPVGLASAGFGACAPKPFFGLSSSLPRSESMPAARSSVELPPVTPRTDWILVWIVS
jgi:hypothetical protein